MHRFVEKNIDKVSEFRAYKNPDKNTVAPNGQPGFVMKEDAFNKVYNTLVSALKPSGPFKDGVTLRVTNLTNRRIANGTHAIVSTRFQRDPIGGSGNVTFEEGVQKASVVHPTAMVEPTVEPFEPQSTD